MAPRLSTLSDFWPFYLGQHALAATRWLHFVGSTLALGLLVSAAVTRAPWLVPLAVVQGYAWAWFGHFFIEKNRPATFTYPLWSFVSDWRMWALMATGGLGAELSKYGIGAASSASTTSSS